MTGTFGPWSKKLASLGAHLSQNHVQVIREHLNTGHPQKNDLIRSLIPESQNIED